MIRVQKGLGSLGIIIAVAICALVIAISWLLWDNHQTKNTLNHKYTAKVVVPIQVKQLTLLDTKIPGGWSATLNDETHISLNNKTSKCFVDVVFTHDTTESSSSAVDPNKQTVDSLKSKGYIVKELPKVGLTISTTEGDKLIGAQNLDISGQNNPLAQNYAYILGSHSFGQIQLSCPKAGDLPIAQKALLAIQIKVPKQIMKKV